VASVLLADRISKIFAIFFLSTDSTVPIIPHIFHLTLVRNPGIAFGFFREHPSILLWVITLSLVALGVWGHLSTAHSRTASTAIAFIFGGALGNWGDRLYYGAVIDFLDFRVWPIFNFADTFISIGVFIYLLLLIMKKERSSNP